MAIDESLKQNPPFLPLLFDLSAKGARLWRAVDYPPRSGVPIRRGLPSSEVEHQTGPHPATRQVGNPSANELLHLALTGEDVPRFLDIGVAHAAALRVHAKQSPAGVHIPEAAFRAG